MFERNRIDNSRDVATVTVIVERDDGRQQAGRFHFPRSKSLIDVLNGATAFIEFSTLDGDGRPEMIAKTSIRSLRVVCAPPAALPDPARTDGFDPYAVLGLERGAESAAVRDAFHRLSKRYHPDRYAGVDLPDEVADYLEAMARRVNAAYEVLSAEVSRAERLTAHRAAPVYEKAPHAV